MILVRDDDRDQGLFREFENRVVNAVVHALFDFFDFEFRVDALVVRADGPCPRLEGIELALRVRGRRVHVTAPVVEHLRDMDYVPRFLGHAEDKVIVLGAVIGRVKLSDCVEKALPHRKEVTDIVDRAEQIRVKVRLKMRVEERTAVHVELVLVGVETVCLRLLHNGLGKGEERLGRQNVVVVAEHHKIARRKGKRRIRIARDAAVFAEHRIAYSRIARRIVPENSLRVLPGAAAVRKTELELRIGLREQGVEERLQIHRRCLKERNHNREEGCRIVKDRFPLAL